VSSQYRGPSPERPDANSGPKPNAGAGAGPDANAPGKAQNNASTSERWGPWQIAHEETQPYPAVSKPSSASAWPAQGNASGGTGGSNAQNESNSYAQFTHREHVTAPLPAFPPVAPLYPPAYNPPPVPGSPRPPYLQPQQGAPAPAGAQPYPAYPPYPGYPAYPPYPPYPGYGPYAPHPGYSAGPSPYPYWQPGQFYGPPPYQKPRRDGYQFAMSIVALIASCLAILAGLACAALTALVIVLPTRNQIPPDQAFSGTLTLIAFTCAGLIGGGFALYQSIRSLMRRPSAPFALPMFWIFAVLYVGVLAIGFALKANKQAVAHAPLTALLIFLAAIFPALALLAIADRRMRARMKDALARWPTTWRRFTISLVSGATLSIGLALALELGLTILLVRGANASSLAQCINQPDLPACQQNPAIYSLLVIVAAVIAPLVEETVKPLAVALYIGRVRGAAEAFMMGMAAGIGFDLIETVGYIGTGYHSWVDVALERTGTGLLHGFGAGMVALGWYYLTQTKEKRFLKAFGCWLYAVLQHAIWNGSATLVLMPAPVGPTLSRWNLNLGFTTLPFTEILNIAEAILFFGFFLYMTGRLKATTPPTTTAEQAAQPREPQLAARSS
jgi:RsiW-degrading membrane proteinase PrsW (M82 family)